jgi:hypothetical protein
VAAVQLSHTCIECLGVKVRNVAYTAVETEVPQYPQVVFFNPRVGAPDERNAPAALDYQMIR